MGRRLKKCRGFADFGNASQVHDRHAIGNMAHDRQVMSNEEDRDTQSVLDVSKKVNYLCLNGNVKGRDRFIADEDVRAQGQCPGDPDPLALSA